MSDGDKLSIYVFTAQTWPLTPGLFAWVKIVKLEHECMNGKFLVSVSACTFQAPLIHHYWQGIIPVILIVMVVTY